ncbi:uncharacterized protein LOC132941748 [Metopolophium dirhodum]|uniref:uncharacterized protein LOC132941748 n=1 Tax=Metopolophium dirhodum TaxID=44670 RepID=UPI00298F541A|nr:uncharacterized protein LOC132941748 [Metopolophium dirhodum]XP_060865884.1 uncharacterized protein LOC132941748 [Metopolophium dirhodum]
MLNLKVMMFLCLSVIVVYCENDQNKLSNAELESCLLETKIPKDEFEDMVMIPNNHELKILKTHAQKCMMSCMMRKNHIINNGSISGEVLYRYVLNYFGTSDYKRRLISRKVEQVVDICAKKDNLPTEECALAEVIVTCIRLEANKVGLQ